MRIIGYAWMGAIVLFLAGSWLSARRRVLVMKDFAKRHSLQYLDSVLPYSLNLAGTPLEHATATSNVIAGQCNGIPIVVFDCRIGHGKTSWSRTVIAAEADADVFAFVNPGRYMTVDRSGDWVILHQPKELTFIPQGLMPRTELEAHLDGMRK